MTQKNARFWVWGAGDAMVKLTIRPGESLSHRRTWDNGEGWSSEAETWSHEGDHIERERYASGTDCDGRHSSHYEDVCPLRRLGEIEHGGVRWPAWSMRRASQRDYSAEAMGY